MSIYNMLLGAAGKYCGPVTICYLVIAGGAYGGFGNQPCQVGGGGGAGGYKTGSSSFNTGTTYTLKVGGANDTSVISGAGFTTITSAAGGRGASGINCPPNAQPGGSGGGGGISISAYWAGGAASPPGQGNAGGSKLSGTRGGAGGGGGSVAGACQCGNAGANGGNGYTSSIFGGTYAGGGGGGGLTTGGTGGSGGGGNGYVIGSLVLATPPTINTGSGSGGGFFRVCPSCACSYQFFVSCGASGVVFVRYPNTFPTATTTGSPTLTCTGGYRVYKFTGTGTLKI